MYSVLRVDEAKQVPLLRRQARRLGVSESVLRAFASGVTPGVYRVTWNGTSLEHELRPASRLVEGMPTRLVVSPFAEREGRFAKPRPPSPYDDVRVAGVSTLLTSVDGHALFESCSASLVAWDGSEVVLVPLSAPGVASLAEEAVAEGVAHRRAVLEVESQWPLLLINAVAGTCGIEVPGRRAFPDEVRELIQRVVMSQDG